jgi:hypothetical protein
MALLLDWLREDGWISADDAERVTGGFGRCQQPARAGAPGRGRPAAAGPAGVLDTEA